MIQRTTERDTERENLVCQILEREWKCLITRTGYLDDFDIIAVRQGRTQAIGEIKNRNNPSDQYRTVFFAAHKWLRLLEASRGLGVPGLFIVNFTDQVRYIDAGKIDARDHEIAGRMDRPDAPNDQELIIHVPVGQMRPILKGPEESDE